MTKKRLEVAWAVHLTPMYQGLFEEVTKCSLSQRTQIPPRGWIAEHIFPNCHVFKIRSFLSNALGFHILIPRPIPMVLCRLWSLFQPPIESLCQTDPLTHRIMGKIDRDSLMCPMSHYQKVTKWELDRGGLVRSCWKLFTYISFHPTCTSPKQTSHW